MAAVSQKCLAQHAGFERAFANGDLRKRDRSGAVAELSQMVVCERPERNWRCRSPRFRCSPRPEQTGGRGISVVYRYSQDLDAALILWLIAGP